MTEQQRIEELMKPRVIVENLWPNCNFDVGDILVKDGDWYWPINVGQKTHKNNIESFPYLMRPLKWWEERKPEEMPEYIKMDIDCRIPIGTTLKANWETYTTSNDIAHRGKNPDFWIDAEFFSPATSTEYQDYLNQNK